MTLPTNKKKRIAVDVKNLALFGGGISHFIRPLLKAWIQFQPENHFFLVGPHFDQGFLTGLSNFSWFHVPIAKSAPGPIKHPLYDLLLAPVAIRRLKPDLFFSPYFDICCPGKTKSIITVHDLCFSEARHFYSPQMRWYYLGLLHRNIRSANRILTVSETTKSKLQKYFQLRPGKVHVVYNSWDGPDMYNAIDEKRDAIVKKYGLSGYHTILYPGGLEFRKNIDNLIKAIIQLAEKMKKPIKLLITGDDSDRSISRWRLLKSNLPFTVTYTGFIDREELIGCYFATDCTVYLSACEGFGRVCLESMSVGTPIVCSNLEVFKEVAGDYPIYCNPFDIKEIAQSIQAALHQQPAPVKTKSNFLLKSNIDRFINAVNLNI